MPRRAWNAPPRRAARAAACVILVAALAAGPSSARPLQLEDLLQREAFGAVTLAPGERWLLVEQRRAFAAGGRYDFDRFNGLFRTELMVADLAAGGPLRPLFAPEPGVGYKAGPVSPDGARALVYRLTPARFDLGVATFATGDIRWLGVTPEIAAETRTLQWVSPTRFVAIAMAPGALPYELRAARPQAASPALWAASARGATAVTAVGSGRWISVRPRAEPKRLLQVSADTGAVETLATGDFVDLEISATGRLAVLEAAEDIPLVAGRPVQGPYGIAVRRMRLRVLDLATRTVQSPCPGCDVLTSLLSWSPRGDQLLAYVRADGAPWTEGRLIRVDCASGRIAPVDAAVKAAVARRPERVSAGWWGSEPLLFGRLAGDRRDDWFRLGPRGPVRLTGGLANPPPDGLVVSPEALIVPAGGAAWRVDRRGRARRLSPLAFATPPRRAEGIPDRTTYALRADRRLAGMLGSGSEARAVRLDVGGRSDVSVPMGATGRLAALGASGAAVDDVTGGGEEALVWRRPQGADVLLGRINTRLADVDRPAAIPVEHAGPNGEALRSWLFLPPSRPGAQPPPLVVVPYPGTTYRARPDRIWEDVPMAPTAVLIGHGYAVLLPSLPTWRAGRGPADGLADRILSIVDAAARRPELAGRFDAMRLGLWGHSFGGYATVAILGQTERFRAGVATAPTTDLTSFYGQFDPGRRVFPDEGLSTPWTAGWLESLQGDMRAPPWEDPGRYLRNSPLMQAGRIRTPLLIAYGEIDGAHPGQAEEMFSALYRQNKDALLLTYWGEAHLLGSPGNLRDLYTRGLAFLDAAFTEMPPQPETARRLGRPAPASANTGPRTPPPPPP